MKMRKILTCLIAIAVFIALLSSVSVTVSASGSENVSFTVAKVTAKAGGTTTVELKIKGDGIAGFQGKMIYDKDKLTIEKIEATDLLPASGMSLFDQDATTGEYLSGAFVYACAKGTKMDGAVLKFTFKAAGKASGTLPLTLEEVKVYNAGGKEIKNAATAGSVTISGTAASIDDTQSGGNQSGNTPSTNNNNANNNNANNNNNNNNNPNGGVSGNASDSTASTNISMGESDTVSDAISGEAANASQNESDPSSLPAKSNTLLIIIIALAVIVVIIIVVIVLVNRKKRRFIG